MGHALYSTLLPQDEVVLVNETRAIKGDSYIGRGLFTYKRINKEYYQIRSVYMTGFIEHLAINGFYYLDTPSGRVLVHERNGIVKSINFTAIKDFFRDQLSVHFEDSHFEYNGMAATATYDEKKELFLNQAHRVFNEAILNHLNCFSKPMLQDSLECSYVAFSNGIFKVTSNDITVMGYDQLGSHCIWQDRIIGFELQYEPNKASFSMFASLLGKICNNKATHFLTAQTTIGYLLCRHKSKASAKAVLLYDQELSESGAPQGGTGKGLFMQAISKLTNVVKIDGKQYVPDNRFKFQSVKASTDLVFVDDPNKNVRFEDFHSVISDGWNFESKNKDARFIPFEDGPKLAIASNRVLESEGNTNKRRQHILEFGPYLRRRQEQGSEHPILEEFGVEFFSEWSESNWTLFYSFMLECLQVYLVHGLVQLESKSTDENYLIQQTHKPFIQWADQYHWAEEIDAHQVVQDYQAMSGDTYIAQRTLTRWLRMWATQRGYRFSTRPSNGKTIYQVFKPDLFE